MRWNRSSRVRQNHNPLKRDANAFPPAEIKHFALIRAPREGRTRRRERIRLNKFARSVQKEQRTRRPRLRNRYGEVVR